MYYVFVVMIQTIIAGFSSSYNLITLQSTQVVGLMISNLLT